MNYYMGIDPGKSGGFAVINQEGYIRHYKAMPKTEHDIADFLRDFSKYAEVVGGQQHTFVLLEKVHAMPASFTKGKIKVTRGMKSTWSFAENYGFLRGVLTALNIPFDDVQPMKWQRPLGLVGGSLTTTEKKNKHKEKAQQLFPELRITHATSDALLIAYYALHHHAR